jgi:hypothetical protein
MFKKIYTRTTISILYCREQSQDTICLTQRVLNDLQMTRLYRRRMIWLLSTPSSISKFSLILGLTVCRRSTILVHLPNFDVWINWSLNILKIISALRFQASVFAFYKMLFTNKPELLHCLVILLRFLKARWVWFSIRISSFLNLKSKLYCRSPEVEFLEEIQTEVLRVFLLAIHRHLY